MPADVLVKFATYFVNLIPDNPKKDSAFFVLFRVFFAQLLQHHHDWSRDNGDKDWDPD
jgi:hypothetical protein